MAAFVGDSEYAGLGFIEAARKDITWYVITAER